MKNKKSQRYINTPTHKQTQTDKQQREIGAYRNDRYLTGTIEARGFCLIGARGSRLIETHGYGSCLIGAREIH